MHTFIMTAVYPYKKYVCKICDDITCELPWRAALGSWFSGNGRRVSSGRKRWGSQTNYYTYYVRLQESFHDRTRIIILGPHTIVILRTHWWRHWNDNIENRTDAEKKTCGAVRAFPIGIATDRLVTAENIAITCRSRVRRTHPRPSYLYRGRDGSPCTVVVVLPRDAWGPRAAGS